MFEKMQRSEKEAPRLPPSIQPRELLQLPATEQSKVVAETFAAFRDTLTHAGYVEFKNIADLYRDLSEEKLIVRREDPARVFALTSENQDYAIDFEETRYANCVEWSPVDGARNIQNAYLEGYGQMNGIVTVVGISNADGTLDVEQLPDSTKNFHGLDRQGVRSMKGVVHSDMVRFISLRIPGHLFPESQMTEDERDELFEYRELVRQGKKPKAFYVHRGYEAPQSNRDLH